MRSALTAFRPFQPDTPLRNASTIFILTTLFYFVGAELRLVEALSLFWPLNGVMAGIFARYVFLHRLHYYAVSYVAMLMYDAVTTNWGIASVVINLSNMVFIVVVAVLIQRDRRLMKKTPDPLNALRLFNYCLIAALLCALLGAVGSVGIDSHTFWPLFADWFSEQFSTGVLVVPCMLTIGMPVREFRLRLEQLLPVIALIVSVIASVVIGGTLLSGGVGTVLGTLFGVAIQGLIQTYINFDGTLSSWWTKIAIGILLFIFIALQRGLTVLWENRQSSPVTRVNTSVTER